MRRFRNSSRSIASFSTSLQCYFQNPQYISQLYNSNANNIAMIQSLYEQANQMQSKQMNLQAISYYTQVLSMDLKHFDSLFQRCKLFLQLHYFHFAYMDAQQLLQLFPSKHSQIVPILDEISKEWKLFNKEEPYISLMQKMFLPMHYIEDVETNQDYFDYILQQNSHIYIRKNAHGRGVYTNKLIKKDEIILTDKRSGVAVNLDPNRCDFCFDPLQQQSTIVFSTDKAEHYCSEECKHVAWEQYMNQLQGHPIQILKQLQAESLFGKSSTLMVAKIMALTLNMASQNNRPLSTFDLTCFATKSLCKPVSDTLIVNGRFESLTKGYQLVKHIFPQLVELGSYFDFIWYTRCISMLMSNAYLVGNFGVILPDLGTLVNHQCENYCNAQLMPNPCTSGYKARDFILVAQREIAPKEEITVSYSNDKKQLLAQYGINCNECVQCKS